MERTEPKLVPEWLKNTGGGSISHSDDHSESKLDRNKPFVNSNGHDIGRSSSSERTTSSYFRRSSSSNGSGNNLRPYSSFGRNNRDRDWEKDIYDSRGKDKSFLGDRRHRDPLGNNLSSKFERDGLRRSQSMISGKRGETWPRKVVNDSINAGVNSTTTGLVSMGSRVGGLVKKASFERDFPSLGAEERGVGTDVGRVPSPGLSSAIQSLPIGASAIIGGEKWTSALAEVPVLVGNGETAISSVQQVGILNMAEAVAQGPVRAQTAPELSSGTQRLEELAIKQSRQLIPVTPSMPKTLPPPAVNWGKRMRENLLSCSDSTHLVYRLHKDRPDLLPPRLSDVMHNSLEQPAMHLTEATMVRGIAGSGMGSIPIVYRRRKDMPDLFRPRLFNVTNNGSERSSQQLSEATTVRGIAHSGTNPTYLVYRRRKDMPDRFPPPMGSNSSDKQKSRAGPQQHPVSSSSPPVNHSPRGGPVKGDVSKPSNVAKLQFLKPVREKNGVTPVVKDNLSPKRGGPPNSVIPEQKPILTMLEKRSTSQTKSRNDFFNLVRKKSIADTSSVAEPATANSPESPSFSDKLVPSSPRCDVGSPSSMKSLNVDHLSEERGDLTCNGDVKKCVVNGKEHSGFDPIISDEKETAFLRSLGWEENDDDGGLTEEEINGFYRDVAKYINSKPSLRIPHGVQQKFLVQSDPQIGGSSSGISSGVSSSDAKLES